MKRFFFLAIFMSGIRLFAQTGFYAVDTIQTVDITFTQPNWDYMMDTAKAGSDGYLLAAQVVVNGVVYDSAGVKFKGNSSYDSTRAKNPLHIKLDYIHDSADYDGHEDIKLGNGFSDPTSLREVLAYEILRNYMAAPECNFARVTINGNYYGLFSSSESIDSDFNSEHFYSSDGSFFKCTPQNVLSGQVPNLLYLGTDSANYSTRYEIKSTIGWMDLIAMCDTLANSPSALAEVLDIDRALWMLAFNNVCVNLDSYSGAFSQNYYLYRDDNNRFNTVMWDLNMCFGGFTNTGTSNLTISTMQTMTPLLHSTYGARPLIMKLLADSTYYRMYIAHMRTITNEFFADSAYYYRALQLQALIDSSAQADSNSFYSYTQFQQAISTNTGSIPGLTVLMDARIAYLESTSQFMATPPTISLVNASPAAIALYDSTWITCSVTNANEVYLGYRDEVWRKFTRVMMYDDGLHGDGTAGDGTYGASMQGTSALMQYYIYAENANAGMFSPERAEYEFYNYTVVVNTAASGQVVINELLSYNMTGCTDGSGVHEDWVELFNTTGNPLNLSGLYLTDDPANHFKYAFPPYIIPAYGHATVWCDEDGFTAGELHANFKLASGGEFVLLCNASGTVLDSIAYALLATDESYGRCPNGYGPFIIYTAPSCGGWNVCPGDVAEEMSEGGVSLYPNPATDFLYIQSDSIAGATYEVYSVAGQICLSGMLTDENEILDISSLTSGTYLLLLSDESGLMTSVARFSVVE